MRIEELCADVLMFVGDAYESVCTAFIDGDEVLLIDALGSEEDAHWLRSVLCDQMGLTVRLAATTHYMSDHMAGLTQFPEALVMAHRHHRHTFLSQNRPVAAFYRTPDIVFDNMAIHWGRHQLRFLFNPGKTMDHFSIDVPTADLAFAGDNIVGNTVYLSKADPILQASAIGRIRQFGRSRVVGGHIGVFDASVLDNALHYLERIREHVVGIRAESPVAEVSQRIASIRIEDCVELQVEPTAFEREWHGNNLDAIVSQSIFALDASLASTRVNA
ncbi:MBL fold metallo-hydrolase [Stenotrophomonas sp. PSU-St19]